jgi:hypothetical protein
LKLAKLIARLELRIKNIWAGSRRGNEPQTVIERELYSNRYRHRSKNDDDLPVERGDHSDASAPNN